MSKSRKAPPKRAYRSSLREAQAAETRRKIVQAAHRLFMEQGYPGTTMATLAEAAGVAVETVYAAFGSKKAILARVIETSLLGDDQPTPLFDRPGPQSVRQARDPRRQVGLFAADMRAIMGRVGPLLEILRSAARSDAEMAELLGDLLKQRLLGMRRFVDFLRANGPLRAGLSPAAAAETIWALTSADLHRLLTVDRGWSDNRYQAWLADSLDRLLLP